jgi:citronellol/citronellal dehydrogenase
MNNEKRFNKAVKEIMNLSNRPDDKTLLLLYSLYKQAKDGDVNGGLPINGGIPAIAKYRAWKKQNGKSSEDAMSEYADLVAILFERSEKISNIESWKGRTVLISGASRGLGRAMALRFAEDGANLVLLGRTLESNDDKGSLKDTAKQVESLGGKAVVAVCDVRNDEDVIAAVQIGVDSFGGIDAVICNAGALFIAPFDETPMKRFDLVHEVNVRASFSLCQAALPHLRKSDNGRILVICPPPSLDPKWYKGTIAYTISKFSMSMLVLGLSEELSGDGIAVNGMWPATTIDTAAVRYNKALGGEEMVRHSRKSTIVGDAAFIIMSKSGEITGGFHTDESILRGEGVEDFDQYAVEPGMTLQPDYYL